MNLKFKEFLLYLEQSLDGYSAFCEKALEYQEEKNKKRAPGKRWDDEKLQKAVYDMWKAAMEPLYNKIKLSVKSESDVMWNDFIKKNDILDTVNESISELDFNEQDASA